MMHCGSANPHIQYTMKQGTRKLEQTSEEKDLDITVTSNLKPTQHCLIAANKARSALALLKIAFSNITVSNFRPLYTVYVRPHLEYCIQAVGPYMAQDYLALEKIQRRATKLVPAIWNLPYDDRLRALKLPTVKERLLRGDLIETYKILTGKTKLEPSRFFERNQDERTRGHHLKLKAKRAGYLAKAKFFSHRGPDRQQMEQVTR